MCKTNKNHQAFAAAMAPQDGLRAALEAFRQARGYMNHGNIPAANAYFVKAFTALEASPVAQHEAPEELTTAELIRAVSHAAQPDITSIAFTAAKDVVIDGKPYKAGEWVEILSAQHEAMASAGGQSEPVTCPCGLTIKPVGNVVPLLQNQSTSSQLVVNEQKLVEVPRDALREAELRGIKAGLEAAAKFCDESDLEWDTDDGSCPLGEVLSALNPETILEGK